jgi:hypothetical protein
MARITTTVILVEGDLVSGSLEREHRVSIEGSRKIGYALKLLGRAKSSLKDQKSVTSEAGSDEG